MIIFFMGQFKSGNPQSRDTCELQHIIYILMIKLKEKPVCVSKPSSVYLVLDSDSILFIELLDVMNIFVRIF